MYNGLEELNDLKYFFFFFQNKLDDLKDSFEHIEKTNISLEKNEWLIIYLFKFSNG